MKRVCAWCGKQLGDRDSNSEVVTHGICRDCVAELSMEATQPLQDFINELDAPVMVVDSGCVIRACNELAQRMVGQTAVMIEDNLPGDVFLCIYADDPGGCGMTDHCNGCTIRNTVMHTHETGDSCINVPAYLDKKTPTGKTREWLRITTEKAADIVLLKIAAKDDTCIPDDSPILLPHWKREDSPG